MANKFKTNNGLWLASIFNASGNGCDSTILKYLLNVGADPNETETGCSYSPLMFSANIKDPQTSELLLSTGAEVNHQANDGTTALIVAAWNEKRCRPAFIGIWCGPNNTNRPIGRIIE